MMDYYLFWAMDYYLFRIQAYGNNGDVSIPVDYIRTQFEIYRFQLC